MNVERIYFIQIKPAKRVIVYFILFFLKCGEIYPYFRRKKTKRHLLALKSNALIRDLLVSGWSFHHLSSSSGRSICMIHSDGDPFFEQLKFHCKEKFTTKKSTCVSFSIRMINSYFVGLFVCPST